MCLCVQQVRDPRAGYLQTLSVLRAAKECGVYTKSSIMLGLGETGEGGRCDGCVGTHSGGCVLKLGVSLRAS